MAKLLTKFYTGAPSSSELDWEEERLLSRFNSPVRRYLGEAQAPSSTPFTQIGANWREVPLDGKLFHQTPKAKVTARQFAKPASNGSPIALVSEQTFFDADDVHQQQGHASDFLERSFAVHAGIQSSQIAPHEDDEEEETTFVTTTSFSTDLSEESEVLTLHTPPAKKIVSFSGPITNIRAIPDAAHLHIIRPQTVTINLIVGVVNVAPAKTVHVRKGNYSMDVVEMLVGDETKAGFNISSWLPPLESQKAEQNDLRRSLMGLRAQDIVLIQCVALSTFNGVVFGQSLNRRSTKNTTRITLLHRDSHSLGDGLMDLQSSMLSSSIAGKLQRVKDWVTAFVGPGTKRRGSLETTSRKGSKRRRREIADESLPPDTPC